jgi:hypothetical protein
VPDVVPTGRAIVANSSQSDDVNVARAGTPPDGACHNAAAFVTTCSAGYAVFACHATAPSAAMWVAKVASADVARTISAATTDPGADSRMRNGAYVVACGYGGLGNDTITS